MAEGGARRINVTVKTPKDKKTIECDEDETVEKVSEYEKNIKFHHLTCFISLTTRSIETSVFTSNSFRVPTASCKSCDCPWYRVKAARQILTLHCCQNCLLIFSWWFFSLSAVQNSGRREVRSWSWSTMPDFRWKDSQRRWHDEGQQHQGWTDYSSGEFAACNSICFEL